MRFLPAFLAALFCVAALPTVSRADDASDLLAKHKAYVGWQPGDGIISSLVLDGTMTHVKDGAEAVYAKVRTYRKGLASRTIVSSANDGSDSGFTGRVFWESNENGFTHPIVGDAEKAAIAEDMLFNEGAAQFAGTLQGSDTVDGTACRIVRVKASVSDNLDLCIDPQNGALKRAVIDPGGTYEATIDILGYADALPGKKIISKWRYKGSEYTHQWTKITANVPLADAQLHPPSQTATWSFNGGKPFPIEFKDTDRTKGVFLTASFNGVKGRFMMDTGAAGIFLNRTFAGRVHMKPLEASTAYGIGGSTKTETGKVDTFSVGGNTLSNVVVTSMSYDMWNGRDEEGNEVDGVIGYDLFGGAIVELNLDDQQMTLYDPSGMQLSDGGAIPLLVDLATEQPTIPMKVNGNAPVNAMLDSGDLMEVTFSKELVSKYGVRMMVDDSIQNITNAVRFASGAGGVEREECGHLDSISVGPVIYQNAPACKSGSVTGNNAIVGFDFIKNFNIIFDYPQAKMLLLPRTQSN